MDKLYKFFVGLFMVTAPIHLINACASEPIKKIESKPEIKKEELKKIDVKEYLKEDSTSTSTTK